MKDKIESIILIAFSSVFLFPILLLIILELISLITQKGAKNEK